MSRSNEQSQDETKFYDPFADRSRKNELDNLVFGNPWDAVDMPSKEDKDPKKDSPT